jgi:hypothetical protein
MAWVYVPVFQLRFDYFQPDSWKIFVPSKSKYESFLADVYHSHSHSTDILSYNEQKLQALHV